jgi:DNA-directed RNA polymerase subunit RPC12/RpoP
MGNRFASGKHAISECDRCGQRFKLSVLKTEIIKTKKYDLLVCPECWDPDHPQLQLGMWPVDDPQGLRNPRPDRSYVVSGTNGLQLSPTGTSINGSGTPEGGSRIFQWGWNPVGGSQGSDAGLTPNVLAMTVQIGTVTVVAT